MHPLHFYTDSFNYFGFQYQCNKCRNHGLNSEGRYQCKMCQYDLCQKCAKIISIQSYSPPNKIIPLPKLEDLKINQDPNPKVSRVMSATACFEGHPLIYSLDSYGHSSGYFSCKNCNQTINCNNGRFECKACLHNICNNCKKNLESLEADPNSGRIQPIIFKPVPSSIINLQCHKKHFLKYSNSFVHPSLFYTCQKCQRSNLNKIDGRYSCQECNYNVCLKCIPQ